MPSKGTTHRSYRCGDDLYLSAKAKAQAEGTTLTEVIVSHLRRYVGQKLAPEPKRGRYSGSTAAEQVPPPAKLPSRIAEDQPLPIQRLREIVRTSETPHEFKPSKANPLRCETCGTTKGRHP